MMHTFTLENGMVFRLQPLQKEEINEARLLCDACVGTNLYSADDIAAAVNNQDRFFYLLKSEKDETIGYVYYYLTNVEDMADASNLDTGLFRAVYSRPDQKVGKIQSIGLKEAYRGRGLAVQMIRFILAELKKLCIDIIFIVCWKPGGIVPLGKTLAMCHFNYLTEAKKVWYDDTRLICPYCSGRCLCDAEVYYKLL